MGSYCLLIISLWNFCGTVKDAETGLPIENAVVSNYAGQHVITDANGEFCIELKDSSVQLTVYKEMYGRIALLPSTKRTEILLKKEMYSLEEVVISTIRSDADMPVTALTLNQSSIERNYAGQETQVVLAQTPSITWYSDGGGFN